MRIDNKWTPSRRQFVVPTPTVWPITLASYLTTASLKFNTHRRRDSTRQLRRRRRCVLDVSSLDPLRIYEWAKYAVQGCRLLAYRCSRRGRGQGALAPPPKKKNRNNYFTVRYQVKFGYYVKFPGFYHVKFGHFVDFFSGKYHEKFLEHFVNFSHIYFRAKCLPPKLTERASTLWLPDWAQKRGLLSARVGSLKFGFWRLAIFGDHFELQMRNRNRATFWLLFASVNISAMTSEKSGKPGLCRILIYCHSVVFDEQCLLVRWFVVISRKVKVAKSKYPFYLFIMQRKDWTGRVRFIICRLYIDTLEVLADEARGQLRHGKCDHRTLDDTLHNAVEWKRVSN